jgi:transcriptional regulator with XRE-family HTH domain
MNFILKLAILRSPLRTQLRVASETNIREERLSRIVNGWARPTDCEQQAIAKALGADASCLFDVRGANVDSETQPSAPSMKRRELASATT